MTIHSKVAVLNQKQGHFFFFIIHRVLQDRFYVVPTHHTHSLISRPKFTAHILSD